MEASNKIIFGEYEKINPIGKGGFSTVYKVRHIKYNNIRAIKELHEPIEDNDNNSELYRSFCKESETLLRLGNGGHPNIVKIFRSFIEKGKGYFEMDFVDGETLEDYLKNKKFIPINEVIKLVSDIGSALAYCHEDIYQYCMDKTIDNLPQDPNDASKVLIDDEMRKKLITKYQIYHNDIHSKNVMRKINGDFILFDFGLAILDGEISSIMRKTGVEKYMPPEKFESVDPDERSDIYSFGILMFEILTGQVPFNLPEKLKNAPLPEIEPLRKTAFETANPGETYEKDYPDWLEKMIKKCLENKPEDRYFNAKKFFTEFEENLKSNNSKNEEEIEKLKEDNLDLNEQIKQLAKQIAKSIKIADENVKLKEDNEKFQKDISSMQNPKSLKPWKVTAILFALLTFVCALGWYNDKSGYQAKIEQQENQIAESNIFLNEKQMEINNLKEENKKLKIEVENSSPTVDNSIISQLQKENETLSSSNKTKDATITSLKSNNSDKDRSIEKYKQDLSIAQKTIIELMEKTK